MDVKLSEIITVTNLVKKYDGEFPDKYFSEVMNFLNIKREKFFIFYKKICIGEIPRSPNYRKCE